MLPFKIGFSQKVAQDEQSGVISALWSLCISAIEYSTLSDDRASHEEQSGVVSSSTAGESLQTKQISEVMSEAARRFLGKLNRILLKTHYRPVQFISHHFHTKKCSSVSITDTIKQHTVVKLKLLDSNLL